MPAGYPMLSLLNENAVRAAITVRVPRDDAVSRLTIVTLTVEPGYISSEHVRPGPISSAPRYIATPMMMLVTATFFIMAVVFGQH